MADTQTKVSIQAVLRMQSELSNYSCNDTPKKRGALVVRNDKTYFVNSI